MSRSEWNRLLKSYAAASNKAAGVQLVNTVLPYLGLLTLSLVGVSRQWPIYVVGGLAIASGLFMVRTFILFHDCTHDSFVDSKKGNYYIGHILGILTFTPYLPWKKDHGIHHGAVGNLNKRGVGDIWTLTVKEYEQEKWYVKAVYRLFRNPAFLFGVAPYFLFMFIQRIPGAKRSKKERRSSMLTNAGIVAVAMIYGLGFGFLQYFIVQSLVVFVAGGIGVWMFYVQHQFDEVYWKDETEYDPVDAAIKGSTYYKLPAVMEWISGYIGYHHIHHLNARIPNYKLKKSYREVVQLRTAKTVTFLQSLRLALLHVYDEKSGKLISFREKHRMSL